MQRDNPAPAGLLLIDKPAGITSFDVIRRLRRQTGIRKIGHAGTLDPQATGLMLMLLGAATKQAGQLVKLDKSYQGELTFGAVSATGDSEGPLTPVDAPQPTPEQIANAMAAFTGTISQVPPAYSAIKIDGTPAYKRARRGETVTVPAREVTVYRLKMLHYRYPSLSFVADVSSGTYIRTLAADIGRHLGGGAYLSALRRTAVGQFNIAEASHLEAVSADSLPNHLRPITNAIKKKANQQIAFQKKT